MRAAAIGAAFGLITAVTLISSAYGQRETQSPPPECPAWNANLPKECEPWADKPVSVTAAATPREITSAAVSVGQKVSLTLRPAKTVRMGIETPGIDPPADAHGGILSLRIPKDGKYWIAVSNGLWIDVVMDGKIGDSSDHGPGAHCASIGKTVQYPLKAGDIKIQLSDNRGAHVDRLVTQAP